MKALITGGAGFIGSHIAEQLRGRAQVRVLDNLRTGQRHNLAGLEVEFIEGSILDRKAVRRAMQGMDHVFHLAAMVSVVESVGRPDECAEINITGLCNVLEEAAAAGVRKLCFSSSAAVYGENPIMPEHEQMLPQPGSPYAATKLEGEHHCRQFSENGRLETVAFRFFNVFGPRQNPESTYAAVVPIFIRRALAQQPLVIYGDGGQTRDFIHVKDIAAANIFGAMASKITGVFNVGYGQQMTVSDLARRIIELTGSRSEIRYEPARAGDVCHSQASVDALRQAGFAPVSSLEAGLLETVDYFRGSSALRI